MAKGPKPRDWSGEQVAGITVLRYSHGDGKRRFYVFRCRCGREFVSRVELVRVGHTRSCGCARSDRRNNLRHGRTRTAEWYSWCSMRQRCGNPNNPKYPAYGGRGIVVCPEWLDSFEQFFADMGPKPSPSHTLDRTNNDGPYAPGNCRWADKGQQARNRRAAPPRPSHPNSLANLRARQRAH